MNPLKPITYSFIFGLILLSCKDEVKPNVSFIEKNPKSFTFKPTNLVFKDQKLIDFYKSNQFQTLWNDKKNREDFISILLNIEDYGLFYTQENLPISQLIFYNNLYGNFRRETLIKADFLYTETFLKTIKLLVHGKVNPKKLYGDWEPFLKKINFNATLQQGIKNQNLEKIFFELTPKNEFYKNILKGLNSFNQLSKDTLIPKSSKDIITIKRRLKYFNDLTEKDFSNQWTQASISALKKFQKRHGLNPSGTINPETLNELQTTKDKRSEQLLVNLERARWIPDSLGENYVMVNIPEYLLYVYNNNKLINIQKVIIGKNSRRTPILSSRFSNLVVNPTWTVPPTILKKDLVPGALNDLSYFSKRNMSIYNQKGEKIAPENWDARKAKSYRYVQAPGATNALGLIKFDFPNDHLVYLHDTANRSKFSLNDRALSSGCVRVQNPFDLAQQILKMENNPMQKQQLDTLVKIQKTRFIKLKKEVQVHQLYWTAWVDENGIQFRKDVYQLDNILLKRLKSKRLIQNS